MTFLRSDAEDFSNGVRYIPNLTDRKVKVDINNKNTDWFNKHCKGAEIIFDISCKIFHYAEAFRITGNEIMYQDLMDISVKLDYAHKMIRDAVGESIHETFRESQESSATILKATLAGCL